jgi:hypothetical protein
VVSYREFGDWKVGCSEEKTLGSQVYSNSPQALPSTADLLLVCSVKLLCCLAVLFCKPKKLWRARGNMWNRLQESKWGLHRRQA